jgi:DNA ligase 1
MSEKLDGVRAVWTGTELLSRLGNKFFAPKWFTDGLGKEKLDGELWMGRKLFSETISIVKSQGLDKEWKDITYRIFDLPDSTLPFEERVAKMKKLTLPKYCEVVEQTLCKNIADLKDTLKAYESKGGEGVMLRQPKSLYEGRRSSTLLKVKSFFDDEAVIVGYVDGKGRHAGKVGAYECKMKNGNKFACGSGLTDKERAKPLAVGTKITFGYCEITKDGIPRFPTYIGEAIDK